MGRAEAGTPKALANKVKSRGLGKLNLWCQACNKQCRDENGFKCHTMTAKHRENMANLSQTMSHSTENFSKQFEREFMSLLKTTHRTKFIGINRFYNQFIQDKTHTHLNATKWNNLTQFGVYLGQNNICRIKQLDADSPEILEIAWIDHSSPESQKHEQEVRQKTLGEQERRLDEQAINDQVKRAREAHAARIAKQEQEKAEKAAAKTDETTANGDATGNADGAADPAPKPKLKFGAGLKAFAAAAQQANNVPKRPKDVFGSLLAESKKRKAEGAPSVPAKVDTAHAPAEQKDFAAKSEKPLSGIEALMLEEKQREEREKRGGYHSMKRQRV